MAEIIWDSELGPSWPADWSHTTVHAQFVAVTGDGADTDRLPDIAPSGNGEVIFTPSLRTVRYVGADGPYVVSLKQYRAVVDNEGYLCTPDTFGQPGERGIVLPSTDAEVIQPRGEDDNAFTWRVDFDIPAVNIRSDHIAVPVGGPYNLVDLLSPERAAGVVHIIDRVSARDAIEAAQEATAARDLVLPARDQTLTARDETLAHGITVDTSVGTRVFVGDTMIYGETGWRILSDELINGWTGRLFYRVGQEGDRPYVEFYATDSSPLDGRNATANEFLIINDLRADGYFSGNYDTAGRLDGYHSSSRHVVRFNLIGDRYLAVSTGTRYTGRFRYPLLRWPDTLPGTPS